MMAAEGRISPICSHGPRALDPVGICQGCRDEAKPVCKRDGCGNEAYAGARGKLVGLCLEHFEDAFLDREYQIGVMRDRVLERDNAVANAYEAIDAGGGA